MVQLSQLILGETGCVSYIIYCDNKKEGAIVDAFRGYEDAIEKELDRIGNLSIKYVIDTHTHADIHTHAPYPPMPMPVPYPFPIPIPMPIPIHVNTLYPYPCRYS